MQLFVKILLDSRQMKIQVEIKVKESGPTLGAYVSHGFIKYYNGLNALHLFIMLLIDTQY